MEKFLELMTMGFQMHALFWDIDHLASVKNLVLRPTSTSPKSLEKMKWTLLIQ